MKVSVIMGIYNDVDTMDEAIESILNQTYKDFELIVCDDCSQKPVYEKLVEYKNKDSRVVVLRNEKNLGLAATLNKCLKQAKGEYIARMDSDDIALPNRFQKEVEFLDSNPEFAIVGGNAVVFNEDGDVNTTDRKREPDLIDVFKRSQFIHPSVMIRKACLEEVQGYTVSELTMRCEDYDLWNKLYEKGYKGYNLEDVILRYRENKSGLKKRKFKHYKAGVKVGKYWYKKHGLSIKYYWWVIRPYFVALFPKNIYKIVHGKRKKVTK